MALNERYADFNGSGSDAGTLDDPWLTPASIQASVAEGDRVNCKDGASYTVAVQWLMNVAGSATRPIIYRGYTTTIGDGGKCTLDGSLNEFISATAKFVYFENFDITHSGGRYNTGVNYDSNQGYIKNCKIVKTTTGVMSRAVLNVTSSSVLNCYIEGRGSNSSDYAILYLDGALANSAVISVNGQQGVEQVEGYDHSPIVNILVSSQASTTLTGIEVTAMNNSSGYNLDHFTIDGFDAGLLFDTLPATRAFEGHVSCGIISGASVAIDTNAAASQVTGVALSDIAFYNNTTDNNMGDNEVSNEIACTADPYEDSAGGDFRPNDTASGGALLQAQAGFAAGVLTTGLDIGALQHADPAGGGGGGMITHPSMSGGMRG